MKLKVTLKLSEAAHFLNCEFIGNPEHLITGLNEIHRVEKGDLVFVDHPKYYDKALNSNATTILVDKKVPCPEGKALLISTSPFDDYNKLTKHYSPNIPQTNSIGIETFIDKSAIIYPNVFIGNHVIIEQNVTLYPGVVIMDNTTIKENSIIGSGTVIGFDAFYYKKKPAYYERMHSCGGVIIEKNVEIGASCTIDKGVSSFTIIGEGSKIDNQVQIGHDTIVGKNCLMASQVGIAGCVEIKDNVTLWGQVGCTSNVVIESNVTVLAQSGIMNNLLEGKTYFGSPCGDYKEKFRELAGIKKLPEMIRVWGK
jgi:UDP-3-O-[3-hydroxymyristoyl] glucosamine N-acyltransferase